MKKIQELRANKKGFTLAELLIVVAIIGVLVAIAIPVFGAQLDKAKLRTGTANARSNVADYVASQLMSNSTIDSSGVMTAAQRTAGADGVSVGWGGANQIIVSGPGAAGADSFSVNVN